jgi:VanZ family protein
MPRTQFINIILLLIWLSVIFVLSSEPSAVSSSRSGAIVDTIKTINPSVIDTENITFLVRKAAHITAYFILGIIMFRVVRMYSRLPIKAIILSILFVALYAISDELHQLLVNGRSGEVRDVLIDTCAGALGVFVTYLFIRWHALRTGVNSGKKVQNKV